MCLRRSRYSRVWLAVVCAGLVSASASPAAAASHQDVVTSLYRGMRDVGAIERDGPGQWRRDCDGYSGGYITRGPRHREQINVHYMDGAVGGYSRLRNGRFVIYMRGEGQRVIAVAIRRSSTRWDVMKGKRRIGYTKGRDGAEAATALATMC